MYTTEEKLQMYNWYVNGSSFREVSALFAVEYPTRQVPAHGTVRYVVKKLSETGCLRSGHAKRPRDPTVITEDLEISVLASVEANKCISTRQVALEHGISQTSVLNVLKKHKYKSYKYQNHQEQQPNDPENRINFCERMFNLINDDEMLLRRIVFTDESTFMKHGQVNAQNFRYWSQENLHLYNATRTQYPESVNVWAGLVGDRIVGPFFIDGTLTSEKYLRLLREYIFPAINNLNIPEPWFQQDGAPPHYGLNIRAVLNQNFPNRWIGRGGPVNWPARSPDLNPLDFFYWGKLKSRVYNDIPIASTEELKRRILEASSEISPQQVQNSVNEFYNRLGHCLVQNGNLFEHLL